MKARYKKIINKIKLKLKDLLELCITKLLINLIYKVSNIIITLKESKIISSLTDIKVNCLKDNLKKRKINPRIG